VAEPNKLSDVRPAHFALGTRSPLTMSALQHGAIMNRTITLANGRTVEIPLLLSGEAVGHFRDIDGHAVYLPGPDPDHGSSQQKSKWHKSESDRHDRLSKDSYNEGDEPMAGYHRTMAKAHRAEALHSLKSK
jgi:hypothetical protein